MYKKTGMSTRNGRSLADTDRIRERYVDVVKTVKEGDGEVQR